MSEASACAICRICEGSGYQGSAMLGHGIHRDAPILVLGQNPGRLNEADKDLIWWNDWTNANPASDDLINAFSMWTFERSRAFKTLELVFGENWLRTGLIYFSNVVRCRTPSNARPSNEMAESCRIWTERLLPGRKAVVLMGSFARDIILKEKAGKIDWGEVKRAPGLGYVMLMKHYAAWGPGVDFDKEVDTYARAFSRLRERIVSDG